MSTKKRLPLYTTIKILIIENRFKFSTKTKILKYKFIKNYELFKMKIDENLTNKFSLLLFEIAVNFIM